MKKKKRVQCMVFFRSITNCSKTNCVRHIQTTKDTKKQLKRLETLELENTGFKLKENKTKEFRKNTDKL